MIKARQHAMALVLLALSATQAPAQYVLNGYISGVLERPQFQEEFHLNNDQLERARRATETARERLGAISQEFKELKDPERRDAIRVRQKEIADAYEEEITALLMPAQLNRLREITLQMRGGEVFHDAAVRDALKLTAEQRAKVDELLRHSREEMREAFRLQGNPFTREATGE
jgi:hypothetical protein